MRRRQLLQLALSAAAGTPLLAEAESATRSVDELAPLEGELTLYLGRGEGGLYEDVLKAIEARNPRLELGIRRGPTAALANAIVAEDKAGIARADLFWAVDSGALGMVRDATRSPALPDDIRTQLLPGFRYEGWMPVTGRVRTLPYNTERVVPSDIPTEIMRLPESDLRIGWAPAYASFQSFVTAMRLLEGDYATAAWLRAMDKRSRRYAGELGVVMAAERGEIDLGLANHYYTLRLKSGKPDAQVALAFTNNDAGCLVNASGIVSLRENELAVNFMRYLLTREVQSFLAREAYEIPLVENVAPPPGLPSISGIAPPDVDLTQLADMRPTLDLMRNVGVL